MSQDAIRISPGSQGLGKGILSRKQHERRHEKSEDMRRAKAREERRHEKKSEAMRRVKA